MLQLSGKPVDLYVNGELKSTGLIAKHYALVTPSRGTAAEVAIKEYGSDETINKVVVSNLEPGKTVKVDMRAGNPSPKEAEPEVVPKVISPPDREEPSPKSARAAE